MKTKLLGAHDFFDDKKYHQLENTPKPIVLADGLKTPENMGLILRVAGNVGCRKVIFIGDNEQTRLNKVKKTAQTSFAHMDWVICSYEEIDKHIPSDYKWVGIETEASSVSIFKAKFPDSCVFVVGNESFGISQRILDRCSSFIYIPMPGKTVSMNVTHALTATLFEWIRVQLTINN